MKNEVNQEQQVNAKMINIKEGERIRGSIAIDLPDGNEIEGILEGSTLAGNIIMPGGPIKPNTPINLPDVQTVMGHFIDKPRYGKAIDVIAKFLEKCKEFLAKKENEPISIIYLVQETKEEFLWNEEFINNNTISDIEKVKYVQKVALDTLTDIRDSVKSYNEDLVEKEEKGKSI